MLDRLLDMQLFDAGHIESTVQTDEPPTERAAERAAAGRPRFKGIDREQNELRVFALDTLIDDDHAARAIWEFVGELDLTPFEAGIKAVEGRAGQATFDPRLLAALWLYAYSEGIGSAREVSRCCEYQPGFRWLCGDEPVNYHTLADFRVNHQAALHGLFIDALGVLSYQGMVSLRKVAHDGTRIRAVASARSFHREPTIEQHLAEAAEQVSVLEKEEAGAGSSREQAARKRAAEERKQRLEQALEQLEKIRKNKKTASEKEQARASEAEPEARIMKMAEGGFAPAYNAQVTTDSEAGIIVNVQVTQQGSDFVQLLPSLEQVKENFGRMPGQVLVDGGFLSRGNIIELEGRTDLIGPYDEGQKYSEAQRQRQGISEEFAAKFFVYDPVANQFRCPTGKLLVAQRSKAGIGKIEHSYTAVQSDCEQCPHKMRCCPKAPARSVLRIEDDVAVQRFREKMRTSAAQSLYKQRSRIAEFPFCWIKEKFGLRRFHVRGRAKVEMEFLWHALAYNIRQWMLVRSSARLNSVAA